MRDAVPVVDIRRARAEHAVAASDIYLRARAAAGSAIPAGVHSDEQVRAFVAEVMIAERQAWLAWKGGTAVGLLVLDGNELDWLYVEPSAQSQGIGSALLAHAQGISPNGLALWAFTSNQRARGFYEHHGFVAVRATDGAGNEEQAPDVRYVWGAHPEQAASDTTLTRVQPPLSGSTNATLADPIRAPVAADECARRG